MRRAVRLGLALSLAMVGAGVQAMEPNADCVSAYAKAQARMEETLTSINEIEQTQAGVAVVSVGGLKMCAAGTLTVLGTCMLGLGAVNLVFLQYHSSLGAKYAKLDGQNRLYQVYKAYVEGRSDAPEVRDLLVQARVDVQNEDKALRRLADSMESGALCSRGHAQADYDSWVGELRTIRF